MNFKLIILLLALPFLVYGNSSLALATNVADSAVEMACCSSEASSEMACCCDHSDSSELPCDDGGCIPNGCFFNVQYNVFFDVYTLDSFVNFDTGSSLILFSPFAFLPTTDNAIWTPPKIHS